MKDLVMTKVMFLQLVVLPFFGGWFLAWLSSRFLVTTMRSRYRSHLAMLCMILCAVTGLFCFQWVNFLVVNKLFILEVIRLEEAQSYTFDALPSIVCFAFFMWRSYKKITQPCC